MQTMRYAPRRMAARLHNPTTWAAPIHQGWFAGVGSRALDSYEMSSRRGEFNAAFDL